MSQLKNPTRRTFLKSSAAVGGSLVIGVSLPGGIRDALAATDSKMNAWIRIGSDNSITILCARSEMGQGVVMALPTLVAEELEVDLNKVKVEFAPPGEDYINAMLGGQITGGSTSVRDGWDKLRDRGRAGARHAHRSRGAEVGRRARPTARRRTGLFRYKDKKASLRLARRCGLEADAAEGSEAQGSVQVALHRQAAEAPGHRRQDQRQDRVRHRREAAGHAVRVARAVPGDRRQGDGVDDAKAKAMPGVKHVVQITDGVAVVADSWWQAKQARDALNITWDEGPGKALSTEGVFKGLAEAMSKPAASIKKQGNVDERDEDARRRRSRRPTRCRSCRTRRWSR